MDRAAGPQLFGVCFSYGGDVIDACAGGGSSVDVGTAAVSTTGVIGIVVCVGMTGVDVASLVGLGIAVGTSPTGLITFRIYVFATSYLHATRSFNAGTRNKMIASTMIPVPASMKFLLDMRGSVPEMYESKLNAVQIEPM
jgi:hypothetical protein